MFFAAIGKVRKPVLKDETRSTLQTTSYFWNVVLPSTTFLLAFSLTETMTLPVTPAKFYIAYGLLRFRVCAIVVSKGPEKPSAM